MTKAAERWEETRALHQVTTTRLRELQALALHDVLSEKQESEQLRLAQRLTNLEPVLVRLEREARYEQDELDIDAVVAQWGALATAKVGAYEAFREAVVACREAYLHILAVHGHQEHLVLGLPRLIQERLAFPDPGTLGQRIVSRMPVAIGWQQVISGPPGPLHPPDVEAVMDVDPGTKALNPTMIQRFLEERQ